ncbi:unnamed protein product [Lota lota]
MLAAASFEMWLPLVVGLGSARHSCRLFSWPVRVGGYRKPAVETQEALLSSDAIIRFYTFGCIGDILGAVLPLVVGGQLKTGFYNQAFVVVVVVVVVVVFKH